MVKLVICLHGILTCDEGLGFTVGLPFYGLPYTADDVSICVRIGAVQLGGLLLQNRTSRTVGPPVGTAGMPPGTLVCRFRGAAY
jgi:hypothetical protein